MREERSIGSRADKMLRDLLLRTHCLAQHVAAANARAETHNWSTRRQGSLHTIGCGVMTNSKTRPARGETTKQNWIRGGKYLDLDSSVDSIWFLAFTSLGSATSNEAANKSVMWSAEWTITARQAVLRLAQIKYRYLSQNPASRTQFFQVQAIKTGHILII